MRRIVAATVLAKTHFVKIAYYLKDNWRSFVTSIICGLGVGFFIVLSIPSRLQTPFFSIFQDVWVLRFLLLFLFVVLCRGWPPVVGFWRRYRMTFNLSRPPALFFHLCTLGIFAAFSVVTFFRGEALSHWWFAYTYEMTRLYCLTAALAVCGWLIATWLRSFWPEIAAIRPASVHSTTDVYFDNPIRVDDQELLGRLPFVEGLYRQIIALPLPDSFVFGLHGSWGEGKTSVLNLLQNRLARLRQSSRLFSIRGT